MSTMKERRKLWTDALRSGKYKQTEQALYHDGRYCCLGVACKVYEKTLKVRANPEIVNAKYLSQSFEKVRRWLGLRDGKGGFDRSIYGKTDLAALNDDGKGFTEIARIIDSEPQGLFVDEEN